VSFVDDVEVLYVVFGCVEYVYLLCVVDELE